MEHDVLKFALKLFARLDTPRSLACYILASHGEWTQLVSLRADPLSYEPFFHDGVSRYRRDVQATELLRKCEDVPTGFDTSAVALEGFYQCEQSCFRANQWLELLFSGNPVAVTDSEREFREIIFRAKGWIASVLRSLPAVLDGRFGPGATFESKDWRLSEGVVAYDKLQFPPAVTKEASVLEDHLVHQTALSSSWSYSALGRAIPRVRGNRFTTVPKDATKDRGICIEPGVNLFGQLAVGGYIRDRLRRFGLDLETGQDLHRTLAQRGSEDGSIATIDLSNASDTVCRALVKILLPEEWHMVLDTLRSHFTWVVKPGEKGRWVQLQKFSSMGNGFTFELETLLFAGLAHACGGWVGVDSYVYGDDMIVPTDVAPRLIGILTWCGFTPNVKKTFVTGHFRESCGGDYLLGHDVRPFRITEIPRDPAGWISLANKVTDLQTRWGISLKGVWSHALDQIPGPIRKCRGPVQLGDLVIHDDESRWSFGWRNSIRYFRVWRPVIPLKVLYYTQRHHDGVFTKPSARYRAGVHHSAALLGLPSTGLAPRNVGGYRFGRVAMS